jgi:hypothetical protein
MSRYVNKTLAPTTTDTQQAIIVSVSVVRIITMQELPSHHTSPWFSLLELSSPIFANHMVAPCWSAFGSLVHQITASSPTHSQMLELPTPSQNFNHKDGSCKVYQNQTLNISCGLDPEADTAHSTFALVIKSEGA